MENEKQLIKETQNEINFIGFYKLSNEIKEKIISYDDNLLQNNFFKNENIIYLAINISDFTYLIPLENREYITRQNLKKGQTFINLYDNYNYIITLRIALMFPIEKQHLIDINENLIFEYEKDYLKELIYLNKDIIKEKISKVYLIGKDLISSNLELKKIISNYNILEYNIKLKTIKEDIIEKSMKIKGMIKTQIGNKIDYLHKKLRERQEKKINKFKSEE